MNNTTQTGSHWAALDKAAARVDAAMKGALVAAGLLRRPMHREEDLQAAQAKAGEAAEAARNALAILQQEGATVRPLALPEGNLLAQLTTLDTPANRRLLAVLDAAVAAAEEVDAERGKVGDKVHPDDTTGTDLAEHINQIRARVYVEIYGAQGKE